MDIVFQGLFAVIVGAIISTSWLLMAILARMSPALYLPQAVRFGGAALVLALVAVIQMRRLPRLSLRLLHAAVTVAVFSYVLSPLCIFFALRTLASGFAAMAYVTIPLWFLLVAYGEGKERLYEHGIVVIGLVFLFIGTRGVSDLRGQTLIAVLMLALGIGTFIAGLWVSRRLFWLHSALDLNFWSMLFAGVVHAVFGLMADELKWLFEWNHAYWVCLGCLTVLVTGVGGPLYRVSKERAVVVILTVLIPAGAFGLGVMAWRETPLNPSVLMGAAVVVGILGYNALFARPGRWLCLYLNNDRRHKDRLFCHFEGTAAWGDGKTVGILVTDISAEGLGFRCAQEFTKNESLEVSFAIGHSSNRVILSSQIVHCTADAFSKNFPFRGGLQFRGVTEDKWQTLIEFLARLSKAEDR